MNKVEKIKAEIERLKESGCASPIVICDTLLAFIDSMQEEPLIEDLEEEWNRYITSEEYLKDIPGGLPVARHFAKWQKQQMMKNLPIWKKSKKLIQHILIHTKK